MCLQQINLGWIGLPIRIMHHYLLRNKRIFKQQNLDVELIGPADPSIHLN